MHIAATDTMRLPRSLDAWENIAAPLQCGSKGVPAAEVARWKADSIAVGGTYDYPKTNIDFTMLVHGEQRFVHHRPITAGDRLVSTLHVDNVSTLGKHAMVTTRVEIVDEMGEPVTTTTSTIVIRGAGAEA